MATLKVRDVMSRKVVTVEPDAPLLEVLRTLVEQEMGAAPVLTGGRVAGIVSERDVLHALREAPPTVHASDLMTKAVVTIRADTVLSVAARLLHDTGIRCLPVLDETTGELVGIVTRSDLLRAFRTDDAVLAAEVQRAVRECPVEVGELKVEAHLGLVMVRGRVERRSEVPDVAAVVRAVDGVIAVDNRLDYEFDDLQAWRVEGPRPFR